MSICNTKITKSVDYRLTTNVNREYNNNKRKYVMMTLPILRLNKMFTVFGFSRRAIDIVRGMTMKKKLMVAALTCMGVFAIFGSPLGTKVANASVDWDSLGTATSGKASISASTDSSYLYIYLNSGNTKGTLPAKIGVQCTGHARVYYNLSSTKSGNITLTDSTDKVVGTGTISDNTEVLEATISMSAAGLDQYAGKKVSIYGNTTGSLVVQPELPSTILTSSPTESTDTSDSQTTTATTSSVDWTTIDKTEVGKGGATGTIGVYNDGTNLDFYVNTGNIASNMPSVYELVVGGKEYTLNLKSNSVGTTSVTIDGDYLVGTVQDAGSATITDNGTSKTLTGSIPLSKLALTDDSDEIVTLSSPNLGSQQATTSIITDYAGTVLTGSDGSDNTTTKADTGSGSSDPTNEALTGDGSDASSNSSQANNNNVDEDTGITADGDFSDWDDNAFQPMESGNDTDNIKYVALAADNDHVSFAIKMHPHWEDGYNTFQPDGYTLNIEGKDYTITLNNHQSVNLAVGEGEPVSINISQGTDSKDVANACYVKNVTIDEYDGAGNEVDGNGYEWEVTIPTKDFDGVSDVSGQTITLKNTNLFSGTVTATGASTAPVLLAGTGFAIAGLSVYKLSRNKRKKRFATRKTK